MSWELLFFPSGHGWQLRDGCDVCGSSDFVGEVVMAYDPLSGAVLLVCERCYRHRQEATRRQRWQAALVQRTRHLHDAAVNGCACGD